MFKQKLFKNAPRFFRALTYDHNFWQKAHFLKIETHSTLYSFKNVQFCNKFRRAKRISWSISISSYHLRSWRSHILPPWPQKPYFFMTSSSHMVWGWLTQNTFLDSLMIELLNDIIFKDIHYTNFWLEKCQKLMSRFLVMEKKYQSNMTKKKSHKVKKEKKKEIDHRRYLGCIWIPGGI